MTLTLRIISCSLAVVACALMVTVGVAIAQGPPAGPAGGKPGAKQGLLAYCPLAGAH